MTRPSRPRSRRWTPEEDKSLGWWWGMLTLEAIAKRLGRTASSVYFRAKAKGYGVGCPRGMEYLTNAARRCGYNERDLRKILAWAGVQTQRPWTIYEGARYAIVDPDRVDEAVAAWVKTDTLTNAAKRLGVTRFRLAARVAAHPRTPPRPPRGHIWRIPADVLDEVGSQIGPVKGRPKETLYRASAICSIESGVARTHIEKSPPMRVEDHLRRCEP